MENNFVGKKIAYVVNVDWYFLLHWIERSRATKKNGAQVHIICDVTDKKITDKLIAEGFICHKWSMDRKSINPFNSLISIIKLLFILKRISPNLVHTITIKPNIFGGIICRLMNIPYIMSVTGLGIIFSGKSTISKLIMPFVKILYLLSIRRHGCMVLFENKDDKNLFLKKRLAYEQNSQIIPGPGVDLNEFSWEPESENTNPGVLFGARMLWDKGLEDLIKATRLLHLKGITFSLNVAGIIDKSSINSIPEEKILEWHHNGVINWLGQVQDMSRLISKNQIIVLPTSYGEGVPRILIEAAAVGRPIVATNVSGCKEIVIDKQNGYLVPPNAPELLAFAIERLLNDAALRRKFGEFGRKYVDRHFSNEIVINNTQAVYFALLQKRRNVECKSL